MSVNIETLNHSKIAFYLDSKRFTISERFVFSILLSHRNMKHIFVSAQTIADIVGLSKNSISKMFKKFKDLKMLEVKPVKIQGHLKYLKTFNYEAIEQQFSEYGREKLTLLKSKTGGRNKNRPEQTPPPLNEQTPIKIGHNLAQNEQTPSPSSEQTPAHTLRLVEPPLLSEPPGLLSPAHPESIEKLNKISDAMLKPNQKTILKILITSQLKHKHSKCSLIELQKASGLSFATTRRVVESLKKQQLLSIVPHSDIKLVNFPMIDTLSVYAQPVKIQSEKFDPDELPIPTLDDIMHYIIK